MSLIRWRLRELVVSRRLRFGSPVKEAELVLFEGLVSDLLAERRGSATRRARTKARMLEVFKEADAERDTSGSSDG